MAEVKCITDFKSLDGEVIFTQGNLYPINEFGVIDSGRNYFLHWTKDLKYYFIKQRTTWQETLNLK